MAFCHSVNQLLRLPVLFETLFDFCVRCASALKIAFVHHHDVGQIKHHNLFQL